MRRRTDVYIGHMRDGSAIAAATNAATTPIRDGDLASARATLRGVLGDALPAPSIAGAPLDVDVAEAASLYAAVLAASGSARDGLDYSALAYETACRDAQPGSDQRLTAAATHAYLLRATSDPAAAVPVGRDLARQLVARFGATDRRTLAAHGDLAVALHTAGHCLTGRQILHRTGELVRSTYGPGDALGVRMRDRLADLTRQCRATDRVGAEGDAAVRPESDEALAGHICGQPTATASISIGDLFGDLFARDEEGDDHEAVDRPPTETVDVAATITIDGRTGADVDWVRTRDVPPWAEPAHGRIPDGPGRGRSPSDLGGSVPGAGRRPPRDRTHVYSGRHRKCVRPAGHPFEGHIRPDAAPGDQPRRQRPSTADSNDE